MILIHTRFRNIGSLCCCFSFPDSSIGKESTCNAGDPGSIPGWGRSAGEGIGYPLQYSWASLVANLVMNLPAMWETWVPSLGWEDLLEKGKATHSNILAWKITWTEEPPPSMGFFREEYKNGLSFPSLGDLPNPGMEPRSPTLQADSLLFEPPGKPQVGFLLEDNG